jgi:hypothetical protein
MVSNRYDACQVKPLKTGFFQFFNGNKAVFIALNGFFYWETH